MNEQYIVKLVDSCTDEMIYDILIKYGYIDESKDDGSGNSKLFPEDARIILIEEVVNGGIPFNEIAINEVC